MGTKIDEAFVYFEDSLHCTIYSHLGRRAA